MTENTGRSGGFPLWKIAGSAVALLGIVAVVRSMPDIIRYMKIRAM